MTEKAVSVLLQSHLQAVLMDPDKLLNLAKYLKDGGRIEDLAKTLGIVLESLELLKNPKPGPQAPETRSPNAVVPQAQNLNEKWTWSPSRIPWKNASGPKGPYEMAEDPRNPEFQALEKDLAEHHGSLMRDGFYYWLFSEGDAIGRKNAVLKAGSQ